MELQADAITRRYKFMRVASLRLHWFIDPSWIDRVYNMPQVEAHKHLWGYTFESAGIRAFLLAVTAGDFIGHERFFVIAPKIGSRIRTEDLIAEFFPDATIKKELAPDEAAIDSSKAYRFFGWKHDEDDHGGTEEAASSEPEDTVTADGGKTGEVEVVAEVKAEENEVVVNGHAGHVEPAVPTSHAEAEAAIVPVTEEQRPANGSAAQVDVPAKVDTSEPVDHNSYEEKEEVATPAAEKELDQHANGSAVEVEAVADALIGNKEPVVEAKSIDHHGSACACGHESIINGAAVEPEAIAAN